MTIPPRRIKRPVPVKLRPGPVPDPNREKCDCNITFLITQAEYQEFEKLRFQHPVLPTRSQWARYLIKAALDARIKRTMPGKAPDYSRV